MENYYQNKAVSNSDLGILQYEGPRSFKAYKDSLEKDFKKSKTLIFGEQFHCFLLENDKFFERYFINSIPAPTGQMLNYVASLLMNYEEEKEDFSEDQHKKAYEYTKELNGGKLQASADKFKERFITEGKPYCDFVLANLGKAEISSEKYQELVVMRNQCLNHPLVVKMLKEGYENIYEVHNEFEIYTTFSVGGEPIEVKGKLDKVFVFKKDDNYFISIIDFKSTTKSPYLFKDSIEEYNYDRQAAFYLDLAMKHYADKYGYNNVDGEFLWVACSSDIKRQDRLPVVYKCSQATYQKGKEKYVNLLSEYAYYLLNDFWETTIIERENKYIIEI